MPVVGGGGGGSASSFFGKPPFGTPINPAVVQRLGLVGYWPFNEAGGKLAYDMTATQAAATCSNITWKQSLDNASPFFNGSTSAIALPNASSSGPYKPSLPVTLAFTIRIDASDTGYAIFANDASASNFAGIHFATDGSGAFKMEFGGNSNLGAASKRTFVGGSWSVGSTYRVMAVYVGTTTAFLYVNGVSQSLSLSGSTGAMSYGNTAGSFGTDGHWANNTLDGILSNFWMSNYQLTAADAIADYLDPWQAFRPQVWLPYSPPAVTYAPWIYGDQIQENYG
jgi:Concanavalin A-like lectin/glucanases superfamily